MIYPIIGIRPVIDGRRRGIREGLENQTMAMAEAPPAGATAVKRWTLTR